MLLTIHNLPSHMRYVDIKALLQSKCGLSEVILDNLVNEGANKKVTVGLVEEEDAAIVVRHLNGLVMDGKMLYVEDVRQKKASEQPYRSTNTIGNQMNQNMNNPWQGGQTPAYGMGFPGPMMQMDPSAMMMQMDPSSMMMPPMMNGYFMPPSNFMDYNNQVQKPPNMPQVSQQIDKGRDNQQESRDYYNRASNQLDNENQPRNWRREDDNDPYRQDQYDEPGRGRQDYNNEGSRETYRSRSPHNDNPRSDYPGNNNYQNDNSRNSRSDNPRNNNSRNDNPRFVSPQNYNRRFDNPQNDNRREGWARSDKYGNSNMRSNNYDHRRENATSNYPNNQRESGNEGYSDRNPNRNNSSRWNQQERPQREKGNDKRPQPYPASPYKLDRRRDPKSQEAPKDQQRQTFHNPIVKNTRQNMRWGNKEPNNMALPTSQPYPSTTKIPQGQIPTSYQDLIRKCDTWKSQAAAKIKKDMLTKFGYDNVSPETFEIGKAVKLAIRTRLELILKGETVKLVDIEPRYRKVFAESDDKEFFEAILENVQKEKMERDKQPKKEEAASTPAEGPSPAAPNKTEPQSKPPVAAPIPSKPQQSKFVITKTQNAAKPKPQAIEPPPPPVPRLPKYPNSSKNAYKEQKKLQKLEFRDGNLYQLDPPLTKALDEQLDKFCALFAKELDNPADEKEVFVCSKLRNESLNYFRKSLKVNITKRLLNIRTNLIIRVYIEGKIAKKPEVSEFMKKFGVTSLKKSDGKKLLYIANLATYEDYDNILKLGHAAMNDETVLIFKPFQLTGPKQKFKKQAQGEQRAAYLKSLEEFKTGGSKPSENLDCTGRYDDEPLNDEDFENQEDDEEEVLSDDNIDDVETKKEGYDEDNYAEMDYIETQNDGFDDDIKADEMEYKGEIYEVKDEDLEDY